MYSKNKGGIKMPEIIIGVCLLAVTIIMIFTILKIEQHTDSIDQRLRILTEEVRKAAANKNDNDRG